MKKTTFQWAGYTCNVWRRRWTKQWGWEVCYGDVRIDSGARASWADAMRAATDRASEIARWERGGAA